MKPDRKAQNRQIALPQGLWAGLMFCAVFLSGLLITPAYAQSAYACRALESHDALPAVEGKDGVFFRITPDLLAHQAMSRETVADIARLSRKLATRGTTLVLVPVPGRGQVLAQQLPAMARDLGYEAPIATTVHQEMVRRLEDAGIAVADPLRPLRRSALAGALPFFKTDQRPTTDGARVMAQVLAGVLAEHPQTKDLPRATFTTRSTGSERLPSTMRAQLQLACQDALPEVTTETFATSANQTTGRPAVVVVVGTEMTGTEALNFKGFISEFSGFDAGTYGVENGGAYAAISSYLTSADYQTAPPAVLVWELPIWAAFGNYGDQPMKELIAAASGACTAALPLRTGANNNQVSVDLRGQPLGPDSVLALYTGGTPAPNVTFHFKDADGLVRSRSIYRHPGQVLTGRFFMPLSGFGADAQELIVELPSPFGVLPSLSACPEGVVQ